jgi:UDP-N-acetylglucosamine 2-epimerase (non-hydrolysing)
MERPEAQDCGSIILTGFDPDTILDSVSLVIQEQSERAVFSIPEDYQIEDTSWRVLKLIIGNSKLSNLWDGIS